MSTILLLTIALLALMLSAPAQANKPHVKQLRAGTTIHNIKREHMRWGSFDSQDHSALPMHQGHRR